MSYLVSLIFSFSIFSLSALASEVGDLVANMRLSTIKTLEWAEADVAAIQHFDEFALTLEQGLAAHCSVEFLNLMNESQTMSLRVMDLVKTQDMEALDDLKSAQLDLWNRVGSVEPSEECSGVLELYGAKMNEFFGPALQQAFKVVPSERRQEL